MLTARAYRFNSVSASPRLLLVFRAAFCWLLCFSMSLTANVQASSAQPTTAQPARTQTVEQEQSSNFLGSHAQTPRVSGVAYSLKTFEPLYREQYFAFAAVTSNKAEQDSPTRVRVLYSEAQASQSGEALQRIALDSPQSVGDARVFAVKDIDYSDSSRAPYYRITDFRLGQIQAAVGQSNSALGLQLYGIPPRMPVSVTQGFQNQTGGSDALRDVGAYMPLNLRAESDIENPALGIKQLKSGRAERSGLVTDAGFDNYVRENWSALIDSEQKLAFAFAVPSRGQSVAMTIKALSKEECTERVKQGVPPKLLGSDGIADVDGESGERCFRLEAKNWIIAKVLKPIYLVYDQQQRLQWFRGLSNIRGQNNEKLRVLIKYHHAA